MNRRVFIGTVAGGLLAAPLAIGAQPSKVAKVGILLYGTPQADPNLADLRRSLRDLGYLEERNLFLEYRFAEGVLRTSTPRFRPRDASAATPSLWSPPGS